MGCLIVKSKKSSGQPETLAEACYALIGPEQSQTRHNVVAIQHAARYAAGCRGKGKSNSVGLPVESGAAAAGHHWQPPAGAALEWTA